MKKIVPLIEPIFQIWRLLASWFARCEIGKIDQIAHMGQLAYKHLLQQDLQCSPQFCSPFPQQTTFFSFQSYAMKANRATRMGRRRNARHTTMLMEMEVRKCGHGIAPTRLTFLSPALHRMAVCCPVTFNNFKIKKQEIYVWIEWKCLHPIPPLHLLPSLGTHHLPPCRPRPPLAWPQFMAWGASR